MALVAEALLSGLFEVLFERLATKEVVEFLRSKKVLSDILFELKARLGSANKLLSDAEQKQISNPEITSWLDSLRDLVYEADHLLDRISSESLKRRISYEDSGKFRSLIAIPIQNLSLAGMFENSIRFEASEILKKLKVLLDQTEHLGLKEDTRSRVSPERISLSPLLEESDVCGRKLDKEAILNLILSDDGPKISVVPIVGMAGIGKTTLARFVFNDSLVQDHFDTKAWVIVSESFDVARIARTILDSVSDKQRNFISEDPTRVQTELKAFLRGKKFLFVLDDVWSESYELWDVLRSSFESAEQGSKIIVTSRSKIVASKMGTVSEYELGTISDDYSWELFAKHVGFDPGSSPDHVFRVGSEIVKKCKGLPLAVKSIAGVLRSAIDDPDEWRRVLNSDIWEITNPNILPALWLSYQSLPQNLKRCFAYFSIFPKDYEFDEAERDRLILLWIAEGILFQEKGKRMEDVGRDCFNALISRSFFQRSTRNSSTYLMHDLLHDLAVRVSGESSVVVWHKNDDDNDGDTVSITAKTRHCLYWKSSGGKSAEFDGLSEAKSLRSFLAIPLSSSSPSSSISFRIEKAVQRLFSSSGGKLRALSLSGSAISQIPENLDGLKFLRYLDLSGTELESVPDSVCTLYNLQTLLLSCCKRLRSLPAGTSNLISLRRLDLHKTPLREMPLKIDCLTSLQQLSDFVIGESGCGGSGMRELGELQSLHGALRISGLENVDEAYYASQANLRGKEYLSKLELSWQGSETNDSTKERDILAELRPNPNLKEIAIEGFRGTTFPGWLSNEKACLGMVRASLSRCTNCVMLPGFGRLPSLRKLWIQEMENLLSIGDEFCSDPTAEIDGNPGVFPSLEELCLDGLLKWTEWSFSRKTVFENGRFPQLKHLNLELCRMLGIGLPGGLFPSLRSIRIVSCRSMEAVFPASRVPIDVAFPALESIQVWRCPKLKLFSEKGLPSSLRKLEIHKCEALFANRRKWGLQRLSLLERLELSGCQRAVETFPEEGLIPPSLARLRIDSFPSLRCLNGRGFQTLTSLQQLSICECERLENMPDEGLPCSLSYLRIVQCKFLSQRCRRDVGEDWPKIKHIPLIIIDREEI